VLRRASFPSSQEPGERGWSWGAAGERGVQAITSEIGGAASAMHLASLQKNTTSSGDKGKRKKEKKLRHLLLSSMK